MKPSDWIHGLLDLIYPPVCHACGRGAGPGASLCGGCRDSLPALREPFCRQCRHEFPGMIGSDFTCPNCRKQDFAFDFARPAMPRNPRVLEMLHDLKYRRRIDLAG